MDMDQHLRKANELLRRGTRPHYVYFACASRRPFSFGDDAAMVKIGTTYDPDARLSALRIGGTLEPAALAAARNNYRLRMLGYVVGDAELERRLHKAFADYRLIGEWFVYDPIRTQIKSILDSFCKCRGCQARANGSD